MNDRWLTVRQVAQALQVSEKTIRRWLVAGRLRGTKITDRAGWRVSQADLERLMRRTSDTRGDTAVDEPGDTRAP